jgi:predicted dehydrogenase
MLALSYGKHVFVEKPIAMNVEEGEKLLEAFKKAGKLLCVGYMMKYHNLHEKAKEIVKADGIGSVNNVRAQFSCWYPDIKGAWRQQKALGGGGAIMDLAVHCIELIEDILDEEIVDVKAFYSTKTFSYEVEDSAVIIFKTQGGTLGHIDVNFNIPDKASESKLELYGDKGYLLCTGTLAQEEKGKLMHLYSPQGDYVAAQNRTTEKPEEYFGADGNLYLKQISKFTKAVTDGKIDYFYTERAVQVQKIVEKIYNEN